VRRYLLPGKTSIVITGTHGKTTTSALTSWLLLDSGRDPGFLVGGEMRNVGHGYRLGAGPHFVLEGDEYNAAFFDRGPKFLHYEPRHLWVGNVEYDHADLYADLDASMEAFRRVVATRAGGRPRRRQRRRRARGRGRERRVATGRARLSRRTRPRTSPRAIVAYDARGTQIDAARARPATSRACAPRCSARTTCRNALGAIAPGARRRRVGSRRSRGRCRASRACGGAWRSRARRTASSSSTTSAHHPTAVKGTLQAARARFPGRRIWALFEPRSTTAGRKMFEDEYADAFAAADALVIAPLFRKMAPGAAIDRDALVRGFGAAGRPAFAPETLEQIPELLRRETRPGDVLLLMSSGAFGGLPETLLAELGGGERRSESA
jgi:UDP-N-acetylmuramate: L-alanyl-gamma-D-glutamyl-meso-diaminopimelate ligase